MPILQPTSLCHLSRDRVQAYLDDLAALAVRHGIVVETGFLAPRGDDIGGFLVTARGHLSTYAIDSREGRAFARNPRAAQTRRRPPVVVADIAGITAHDLVRRLRRRGEVSGA